MFRTRSRSRIGYLTSVCAAIFTTGWQLRVRRSHVSASRTRSRRPTRFCAFRMHERWNRRSTKTLCCRARAVRVMYFLRCSAAPQACREHCGRDSRTSFMPGCSRHSRSEEHTSELQSLAYLVCRLLLEKKKKIDNNFSHEKTKKKNKTHIK